MSTEKTLGYTIAYVLIVLGLIVACILIFFGVLAIWGAFTPGGGQSDLLVMGGITVGIGLVIVALAVGVFIFLRIRRAKETQKTEIVQKIDLSGDIELEKMKCQNCGAELSKDSITVKEGAIFIACPYCGAAYQMVEEPKW
jgi:amino acid transporter